ncbi:hypothetical protein [Alicyclobacillus mali (ex Roth et al. 2021)]|uniref:hypothetical protein n=1 Tax=Alicyclobacillus mali (ex Roth et al. 2021) TaxID=1123961 RepID=UPI001A8F9BF4|nr:hypothetical protein [Alicyclobacillus mali (ex Roth et al. 2021)]
MEPSADRRAFDEAVWDLLTAREPVFECRREVEATLQDLWSVWERLAPLAVSVREGGQTVSSASSALRKMAVAVSVEISRHHLDDDMLASVARELWTWSERMAESSRWMSNVLAKVQQTVAQMQDVLRVLREQSEQELEAVDELLLHAERLQAMFEKQRGPSGSQTHRDSPFRS